MSKWDGKSRGTVLGYKIFLFFIRTFGIGSAYFILRIVSFYYFLFVGKSKQHILDFYMQALGISRIQAQALLRKSFYVFGQTLIDRTAFLMGRDKEYTLTMNGEEHLLQMQTLGRGGMMLSAHLGNWETAGNMLKRRVSSTINVIMLEAEEANIKQYLDSSTGGGSHFKIIAIKNDLSHIIKINNALSNNELIAMHADRTKEGSKSVEVEFFGRKAHFPLGPFIIASKFNAPISFVYAVKAGSRNYDLFATPLITAKMKPEEIAVLYVKELEKKVRLHPEQWFNYYDFYAQ